MIDNPFIYAVAADRKKIMDKFHVGPPVVSLALRFVGTSLIQRQIRHYAVNHLKCPVMNVR